MSHWAIHCDKDIYAIKSLPLRLEIDVTTQAITVVFNSVLVPSKHKALAWRPIRHDKGALVKLEKLRHNQEASWLILDLIMLGLLVINLSWLIFDWLFAGNAFSAVVAQISTPFHDLYRDEIHPNFLLYDLAFVAIFITEFLLRWFAALKRKTHARWYWYPFIHWYEVLGCIPLTGFRALRLLRIISMLYRLQHLGVIDLNETRAGKLVRENYKVLIEHISDRVVLNVLDGVQEEIQHGHPVVRNIIDKVIKPKKSQLSQAIVNPFSIKLAKHYNVHKADIRNYLEARITEAVEQSEDISRLEKIPMVGQYTIDLLERSISDIVFSIINQTAEDLTDKDNQKLIQSAIESSLEMLLEESPALDALSEEILLEAIDIIKEGVKENKALERVKSSVE